jgi:Family of unknown function (DUF5908)
MPVIINEILITAFVSEQTNTQTASATQNNGTGNKTTGKDDSQIIKTCVEEVLRIIKEKQER